MIYSREYTFTPDEFEHLEDARAHRLTGHGDTCRVDHRRGLDAALVGETREARASIVAASKGCNRAPAAAPRGEQRRRASGAPRCFAAAARIDARRRRATNGRSCATRSASVCARGLTRSSTRSSQARAAASNPACQRPCGLETRALRAIEIAGVRQAREVLLVEPVELLAD